ncbi:Beta-microseminoprotein [Apostichopus japonicus]|uniref:Beta-microseminoprotein n=1 Tax=Stichopus japonicus TaxID=307972 RepID=A0A2G8JVQ2_STIJA|nr:Beta-microseminoprotein [Apostichopus japonicus]
MLLSEPVLFLGERWQSDNCETCRCKRWGYKCCTRFWTPIGLPEECIALWDQKQCQYQIVLRKDETKECQKEPMAGVL